MKYILRVCLIVISATIGRLNAQENTQANIIICIDGEIIKALYLPKLEILDSNGVKKEINISYVPGSLSMDNNDYRILRSQDKFLLAFSIKDKDSGFRSYEIDAGKGWLAMSYIIVNIYNTDNKKYKNKLFPLPGKNYTFELEYSGGQMLRPRKK